MNIKEEFRLAYPNEYLDFLQSKIQVSSAQFDIREHLFSAFRQGYYCNDEDQDTPEEIEVVDITPSMVLRLCALTDSPMMSCKKALEKTNGNLTEAVELLRNKFII